MDKKYQKPTMRVINLSARHFLENSPQNTATGRGNNMTWGD